MPKQYSHRLFKNYNKTHVAYLDTENKIDWFREYAKNNYLFFLKGREKSSSRILEIGCNKGYLLYVLSEFGYQNLSGIDLSDDDIIVAKKMNPNSHIECIDAFSYLQDISNTFDVIILKAVLEHVPKEDIFPLLNLIHNSLKSGGIVIIDVPNMDWLFASHERYMDYTHETGFTRESIAQILRNVFVDVSVYKGNAVLSYRGILSKMKYYLRPIILSIIHIILIIIGEGASDVWWSNRSIIATGIKEEDVP